MEPVAQSLEVQYYGHMRPHVTALTWNGAQVTVIRKKIKHIYLKVSPNTGAITVSGPLHAPNSHILSILEKHEEKLQLIADKLRSRKDTSVITLNEGAKLLLGGSSYTLTYVKPVLHGIIDREHGTITLPPVPYAHNALEQIYMGVLSDWCGQLASKYTNKLGVKLQKIQLRMMKSRWGSCTSSTGRISLNLDLARYDKRYFTYVLVHELAHIRIANHSPDFYRLVETVIPDWKAVRKEMREFRIPEYRDS